ncbi:hypothetical protein [Limnohabitans sp. Rim8]|uniref:hypothetical protein n=1 Tax=Limnohabitans sp. Rim8 TaxID=1100718 RepID=UPI002619BF63|nr:hypothetical protein [Limnohabitans sp. Rim8]
MNPTVSGSVRGTSRCSSACKASPALSNDFANMAAVVIGDHRLLSRKNPSIPTRGELASNFKSASTQGLWQSGQGLLPDGFCSFKGLIVPILSVH